VLGDPGHRDPLALTPHELDGCVEHALAVAQRVLAGSAVRRVRHPDGIIAVGQETDDSVRIVMALPNDDLTRELAIARPDDPGLTHLAVVGDTYTVLLSGEQTAGRFAMIDMLVPPGGGPPPHRHDFEECFRVLEGSLEVQLRDGPPMRLEAGASASIPANAPHSFRNPGQTTARLLCTVAPAGLERFFAEFGDPVATRTSPAPPLTDAERRERLELAAAKAPEYRVELLPPRHHGPRVGM
jgi:quercetin dioxygenase-like cupin family protein